MEVDLKELPGGVALPPGAGSPLVPGMPLSVLPPVDPLALNVLAAIGGLGALIATELGIAGQFAIHL